MRVRDAEPGDLLKQAGKHFYIVLRLTDDMAATVGCSETIKSVLGKPRYVDDFYGSGWKKVEL